MALEDYEPMAVITITHSHLSIISEQRRDYISALTLFRLDLRVRFRPSQGGPLFSMFDFGERHRHHTPSAQVPMGTVVTPLLTPVASPTTAGKALVRFSPLSTLPFHRSIVIYEALQATPRLGSQLLFVLLRSMIQHLW